MARSFSLADEYIRVLERMVPDVRNAGAVDDLPDSCFVEDAISAVPGSAVVLPVTEARRPEAEALVAASGRMELPWADKMVRLDLPSVQAAAAMSGAARVSDGTAPPIGTAPRVSVDGGDVLYTGRELLVGIGGRSTAAGACALAAGHGFRLPVIAVPLPGLDAGVPFLHLKSVATMICDDVMLAHDSDAGKAVLRTLNEVREGKSPSLPGAFVIGADTVSADAPVEKVSGVMVPDMLASNVVRAGSAIMRVPANKFPASARIIDAAAASLDLDVYDVDMSELAKVDGALTCCSVLVFD